MDTFHLKAIAWSKVPFGDLFKNKRKILVRLNGI